MSSHRWFSTDTISEKISKVMFKANRYVPIRGDKELDSDSMNCPTDNDNNDNEHNDDRELHLSGHTNPSRARKVSVQILIATLTAITGILAIIGAVQVTQTTYRLIHSSSASSQLIKSASQNPSFPCYCGTSIQEALSLKCIYVPMSSAWLPPHCRDDYLASSFDTLGPNPDHTWTYYGDYAKTKPTTLTAIAALAGTTTRFYNDWDWHVMHCLFHWRKLHRAQWRGTTLEPRFNSDSHIAHCARLILSRNVSSTTVSGVDMGDIFYTEAEIRDPVDWRDVWDGYGDHPPEGYENALAQTME